MAWTSTCEPLFKQKVTQWRYEPFEKEYTYSTYADVTARVLFLLRHAKKQPAVRAHFKIPPTVLDATDLLYSHLISESSLQCLEKLASSGYITAPLPHIKSEHFQYKKYRLNNDGSGGQMNDNFTTIMSEEKYKCSCNATFAYLTRATDNNVTTRIDDSAFATLHSLLTLEQEAVEILKSLLPSALHNLPTSTVRLVKSISVHQSSLCCTHLSLGIIALKFQLRPALNGIGNFRALFGCAYPLLRDLLSAPLLWSQAPFDILWTSTMISRSSVDLQWLDSSHSSSAESSAVPHFSREPL
ncbi:hypothetical protein LXA43DRAFT_1068821 [Ganoderma leucocontextum]|nr:hypothetical protein LXA43DRAFT_1068821 [Ganoderma leucocontextum]